MIVQNDNVGYLANSAGWETIYVPGQKKCKSVTHDDDDVIEENGKTQCLLNFKKAKSESICL